MTLFERNERGSLSMKSLDLRVLFDEIFKVAKTQAEVEWITENLQSILDITSDETIERIESED